MRLPLSWLKEILELNYTPDEIANVLTLSGLEVDGIEATALDFEGVVVGLVKACEPHPNAERLQVAQVFDGHDTFQVVCGGANCRTGLKTALARVGARIGSGENAIKIKKSKIRSVESLGMLCAEDELGLAKESTGIIELDDQPVGKNLSEIYGDSVFEISLTPNLGHCQSVIGVARELSAMLGLPLKPLTGTLSESSTNARDKVRVHVEKPELCPRYVARLVENVQVGPSPAWLKARLEACGLRSVSNVVDVTNYICMLLGQPLHAFDFDKVQGPVRVTTAHVTKDKSESFAALDGKTYSLTASDLVIADDSGAIALAGVMGGASTEVSESTRTVLLESAHFTPMSIRKTAKRLGLLSEASRRFERGTDANICALAIDLAAKLLAEIADGKPAAGRVDTHPAEFPRRKVLVRLPRINSMLGLHLGMNEVLAMLRRLDMHVQTLSHTEIEVAVPTYRNDIQIEIDLIEEVARLYGYGSIAQAPEHKLRYSSSVVPHDKAYLQERSLRNALLQEGLQETVTCSLISPESIEKALGTEALVTALRVLNPVSVEQSVLRPSLLMNALTVVKHNIDRQKKDLALFELGYTYTRKAGEEPSERAVLSVVLTGSRAPYHFDPKPEAVDFFDLKGVLEGVFERVGLVELDVTESNVSYLHTAQQASLFSGKHELGVMGQIHPRLQRLYDIDQPVYFAQVEVSEVFASKLKDKRCHEISDLPGSSRDWTVSVREDTSFETIRSALLAVQSRILEKVSLVDIFRSEKLGADTKNVTLHFFYRDPKKNIDSATVDAEHARILKKASSQIQEYLKV